MYIKLNRKWHKNSSTDDIEKKMNKFAKKKK